MSKVLVSKEVDGVDKEFDVEVGPDNTVYLCDGEVVIDNPTDAKIHYPSKITSIKSAIAVVLVLGFLTLGIAALVAVNTAP